MYWGGDFSIQDSRQLKRAEGLTVCGRGVPKKREKRTRITAPFKDEKKCSTNKKERGRREREVCYQYRGVLL